jgi:GSH-dependent disulfide-bond oxidoreductase
MNIARPQLRDYPIAQRWQPLQPDILQLYSLATPNGVKVSIMLEELGLPYEVHKIEFGERGTTTREFRSLSLNGKIPAIIDPEGPNGVPLGLFESGAILMYLADKTGKFLQTGARRWETIQWLMWQMSAVGPMFGQVGFFNKFDGRTYEDKRPLDRFVTESKRLLDVLNRRLADREWIVVDYSIADIATLGWVRNLIGYYDARDIVSFSDYEHVARWLEGGLKRDAVQRGLNIPS